MSVSDYFISSHGARKGLADTALRTADSGYLTRRLVDVAQDVIVREDDCDISTINLDIMKAKLCEDTFDALEILNDMLTGRILAENVIDMESGELLVKKDSTLDEEALTLIGEHNIPTIMIRGTSLTTEHITGHVMVKETVILGTHDEAEREAVRENIIRELLGKEITHDVFDNHHEEEQEPNDPFFEQSSTFTTASEYSQLLNSELNAPKRELKYIVHVGDILTKELINDLLNSDAKEIHVRNHAIRGIEVEAIKEGSGIIESLQDRIVGRVLAEDIIDPETNEEIAYTNDTIDDELANKIAKVRDKVSIRSVLTCKSQFGVCKKCYGRDLANQSEVEVGEAVGIIAAQSIGEPGTQLTMRTFHTGGVAGEDITQGLPRVEELFEARKPKHNAIIAEVDGIAHITTDEKGLKKVIIDPNEYSSGNSSFTNSELDVATPSLNKSGSQPREYVIPYVARLSIADGAFVHAGDKLTEGAINPHDILRICGLRDTQRYLVYEVQKVYKSQGVEINDKHIEVMVRQMLHKVKIEESGTTDFLPGEYVDLNAFEAANTKAIEEDGEPAVAKPILLGITKASLATDSFLSAASFQETTRVLTDAAIKGKVDPLIGLKENVIIGKLIPAGTGMPCYRGLEVIEE